MAPPKTPARPKPPQAFQDLVARFDAGDYREIVGSDIALLPAPWLDDFITYTLGGIERLPKKTRTNPVMRQAYEQKMDGVRDSVYTVKHFRKELRRLSVHWELFLEHVAKKASGRFACWLECSLPLIKRILHAAITSTERHSRTLDLTFSLSRSERIIYGYLPSGQMTTFIAGIEAITGNAKELTESMKSELLDLHASTVVFPALPIARAIAYGGLEEVDQAILNQDALIEASVATATKEFQRAGGGGEGPQVMRLGAGRAMQSIGLTAKHVTDSIYSCHFTTDLEKGPIGLLPAIVVQVKDLDAERPARRGRIQTRLNAIPKIDAFALDRPFVGLKPHYVGTGTGIGADPFSLWTDPH